jgi:peroxiredoxin
VTYLGLFNQVVVFGLPGAFTPVCTSRHVPGYVDSADKFKAKGVDNVVCVYAFPSASSCSLSSQLWPHTTRLCLQHNRSVNDPFVMKAWGESLKANNITLVADWDSSFTKLVDKELDLSAAGLGKRCRRYSLIVDNGKIVKENIENAPNE